VRARSLAVVASALVGCSTTSYVVPKAKVAIERVASDGEGVAVATSSRLMLLNASDGVERWSIELPKLVEAIRVANGNVVMVSPRYLRLIAADGSVRWVIEHGVPGGRVGSRDILITSGAVLVRNEPNVAAFSIEDGRELWRRSDNAPGSTWVVRDDILLYTTESDTVGVRWADGIEVGRAVTGSAAYFCQAGDVWLGQHAGSILIATKAHEPGYGTPIWARTAWLEATFPDGTVAVTTAEARDRLAFIRPTDASTVASVPISGACPSIRSSRAVVLLATGCEEDHPDQLLRAYNSRGREQYSLELTGRLAGATQLRGPLVVFTETRRHGMAIALGDDGAALWSREVQAVVRVQGQETANLLVYSREDVEMIDGNSGDTIWRYRL
jgi:outer membrane protein assembly factor BamB